MSLMNYLTIGVMCITLILFIDLNSVNAIRNIPCTGGFKTEPHVANCIVDPLGKEKYQCPLDQCGQDNTHFVSWGGCVPITYYPGEPSGETTQNCVTYGYYDQTHYTCKNANGHTYICNHKIEDRPVISCNC
ncbi:uncharacterized protein MELLADRAFT_123843 [Melampsora larici-populina 98AG31]|uniref:Secreted protein n=1 Tax=Melampsora larici-populina (strain 98AG31 / pathotype 3-4-7) TaxID=747676 RepID=F4RTD9_MELLP|nr:uncharacterized protein MELLADRAFT_123843 [Melampsora larici-populina 98AG31]EGG04357.1 secreted protein [Melampsora larici-populina 98AG31]